MLKTALITTAADNNNHDNNFDYTVADVYDDAAVIGKELEKIITNYGSDILKDLMPKVIHVLELLENLIVKNEKENDELIELKNKVHGLEVEKANRLHEKEKFEKELEDIEDKWKQETLRLLDMVNRLKDENKRLNDVLINTKSTIINQQEGLIIKQEELDYVKQIKEENLKLKDTIRYKDKEIAQKNYELEGLQSQIDNLSSTILNFRRKQILSQNQTQKLVKEKAELEVALKEKEHQLNVVKAKTRANSLNNDETATEEENDKQDKQQQIITNQINDNSHSSSDSEIKDPNRPRYTLNELHEVIMEKNELKVRLLETQEELEMFRRRNDELPSPTGDVQGPINREPDEKLDPNASKSGIRRFFRLFFLNYISDTVDSSSLTSTSQQN